MPYQTGKNLLVAYKVQAAKGTPETGAGALGLRIAPSAGLRLQKATVNSNEVRRDGQTTRGRHGTRMVPPGTYTTELSVGSIDTLLEAVMRSTWTAQATITQATMTSITTTTNTIVAAAGSWITQGVRRGDMVQLTGHAQAGNNGKWMRVVSVTATVITLPAGSLTLDAAADTSFSLIIAKTVVNGATPVERYFTVEEYNADIDQSMRFVDTKITQLEIACDPDANIVATVTFQGLDGDMLATGSSPNFSSPTFTTSLPLIMADGSIRINGVDYADLSSFKLTWTLGGSVPPTLGPTAVDVFLDNAQLSGSVVAMRSGDVNFLAFKNETQIDMHIVCSEASSVANPRPFTSFYIGNAVYDGNDGPIGGEGPLLETIPWRAGKDEGGSDRAATTMKISSSA